MRANSTLSRCRLSSLGDSIAGVQDNGLRYAKAGDLIFELVQKVQKVLKLLKMKDCEAIDVASSEGERFLVGNYRRGEIDFLLLLACSAEADPEHYPKHYPEHYPEHYKDRLEHVAPSLFEDLQVG